MPGDVLQRLALGTAVEHGTEDGKLSGCAKFLPHKQSPVDVAQFNACRLGKEQLGIMLSVSIPASRNCEEAWLMMSVISTGGLR